MSTPSYAAAQYVARIIVDRWQRAGLRWNGDTHTPAPSRDGKPADMAREYIATAMLRGVMYVPDLRGVPRPSTR